MSSDAKTKKSVEPKENSESQVHSANSWETADLGDKQRNEKFLRLMGASKKEHHGKFVIGETQSSHKRDKVAESHMQEELAEQFSAGMEHRLAGGRKGHLGLGFHVETDTPAAAGDQGDKDTDSAAPGQPVADASGDDVEAGGGEDGATAEKVKGEDEKEDGKSREKDERKRESLDMDGRENDKKKMKFVKSSDS